MASKKGDNTPKKTFALTSNISISRYAIITIVLLSASVVNGHTDYRKPISVKQEPNKFIENAPSTRRDAIYTTWLAKRSAERATAARKMKDLTIESSNSDANSSLKANQTTSLPEYAADLSFRLPEDLVPETYYIQMRSYLPSPANVVSYASEKNFTFDGYVFITILCQNTTQRLVLNSVGLTYDDSSFQLLERQEAGLRGINLAGEILYLPKEQMVVFPLYEPMRKGLVYYFQISYSGRMRNDLKGYYKSNYLENGETRWMSVTQFEAMDARSAFPCFDEPSFKAVFQLTMQHPEDMVALGNTPAYSTKSLGDGWMETAFENSPIMSSYLVAFVVAAFNETKSATADNSVQFGAWSRPSELNRTIYASEIGPKILTFFEDYLEIKFGLAKTDQIAVPDFDAGAMENWGLITYREEALLYSPDKDTLSEKFRVTNIIAHELAHQWFGNLVTMKWWDDLWLNEGFATYMSHIAGDAVDADSHFLEMFAINVIDVAMRADQCLTSRSLTAAVTSVEQADAIFDDITYRKGASILNMLSHTLGPELFRQGIVHYLKKFKYGNVDTDDFYKALAERFENVDESDRKTFSIFKFMDSWVAQPGFPLVTVTRGLRSCDGLMLKLSQKRFIGDKAVCGSDIKIANDSSEYHRWYEIPLHYRTEKTSLVSIEWLSNENREIKVHLSNNEWYLINPDGHGFYRVNYDDTNWANLQRQLIQDHAIFSVRTRTKILSDVLNLFWVNEAKYFTALNISLYLQHEENYVPWRAAKPTIEKMMSILKTHSDYSIVENFFRSLVKNHYDRLGWCGKGVNQKDMLEVNFFIEMIKSACLLNYGPCKKQALTEFNKIVALCPSNATTCQPKFRAEFHQLVYCTGVREGNEEAFEYIWQRFQIEINPAEKLQLLTALACASSDHIIKRLVKEALDGEYFNHWESYQIILSIGKSSVGSDVVLDSLSNDWMSYKIRLGVKDIFEIVRSVAAVIATENHVHQLGGLIWTHKKDLGAAFVSFKYALDIAKNNVLWRKQNADDIISWMKSLPKQQMP